MYCNIINYIDSIYNNCAIKNTDIVCINVIYGLIIIMINACGLKSRVPIFGRLIC